MEKPLAISVLLRARSAEKSAAEWKRGQGNKQSQNEMNCNQFRVRAVGGCGWWVVGGVFQGADKDAAMAETIISQAIYCKVLLP